MLQFKAHSFLWTRNENETRHNHWNKKKCKHFTCSGNTFIDEESLKTDNLNKYFSRPAIIVKRPKCTCRFLWNYELHGLTSYLRSKTGSSRLGWMFVILICIFSAFLMTQFVFSEYLERQTATLLTIVQKERLPLPALVFCPKNPDALNYKRVLRDIRKRMPGLDRISIGSLIGFAIAGAGFHNMDKIVEAFNEEEIQRLSSLFRRWRARRSIEVFYHDLFEKNGYQCADGCYYGYEEINCCDVLTPYYAMLRGRCFRFNPIYQSDPDVFGRLTFFINQLPSRLVSETTGVQPQLIVFVSDRHVDVGTFPRWYVNFHEALYLRVRGRRISMLEWNSECTSKVTDSGRGTCVTNKWLMSKVLEPHNCTVFYLRHKTPGSPVCMPETIVRNYNGINNINLSESEQRCLPACHRLDYGITLFRSESNVPRKFKGVPDFRLEFSYVYPEIERYEEVLTTTLPGFISQIGGQFGLFVGLSVCTLIQLFISSTRKFFHTFNGFKGAYYYGLY